MIDDPVVWIAAIIALVLVVVFAIRKGYNIKLKKGDVEANFQKNDPARSDAAISVGRGMKVANSTVGDITGMSVENSGETSTGPEQPVDVLDGAKIKDSEIGDVSGVTNTSSRRRSPSKK
jgi:hypothetical protein